MTGWDRPIVRRSALEAIHEALGATWIADDTRWPAGYAATGSDTEATALAGAAGLAEVGPFEELLLRGPAAGAALTPLTAEAIDTGRVVTVGVGGGTATAWVLGPGEVLLVAPVGAADLAALAAEIESDEVSAIEMSGARTTLRIAGPSAPAILAELCAADLRPDVVEEGAVVQASLVGVRAFIARQDATGATGYTLMVARDEAAYVWDAFLHVGQAHSLSPVGPEIVAAAAAATSASRPRRGRTRAGVGGGSG